MIGQHALNLVLLTLDAISKAGGLFRRIPVTGTHLETLETTDRLMIRFNILQTVPFTYLLAKYVWESPRVAWGGSAVTLLNGPVAFFGLFVVYDFFYAFFHRALHHRSIYKYIHKHHHRQHAPTRGHTDAINTHPFEYVVGEYIHLLALYLYPMAMPLHSAAGIAFVVLGGLMASLNHTRMDIRLPGFYAVEAHDVHHHRVTYNYGQYIMLWDWVMGTYTKQSQLQQKQQRGQQESDPVKKKLL